ncbi:UNVERIFIED_CONTAM: hypothetical protein GTU68_052380 [Idotea baltica]|nr:hypothetical protein [Idotea baltica]
MDNIRQIGSSDIKRVLSYKELLPAIQSTLAAFSRGPSSPVGAVQPLRSRINVDDQNGQLIVMPGYLPGQKALATKILTLFPGNVEKGLSSHNAIVVLMCSETGQMQAVRYFFYFLT